MIDDGVDLSFCCGVLKVRSESERCVEEQLDHVPCLGDVGVDEQKARGLAFIWFRLLCKQTKRRPGSRACAILVNFSPHHCFIFNLHMRVAPALCPL